MQTEKVKNDNTMSIKIFKKSHRRLKIFAAKKNLNITRFVSELIDESTRNSKNKTD